MARRKGWDSLSDSYRKRLTRSGITKAEYESGVDLSRARGHGSREKERFFEQTARFARRFAREYGRPELTSSIRENVRRMGITRGREYMRQAKEATKLYERGYISEAQSFWLMRDRNQPEYMYFYHGIFSGIA